MPKVCSLLIMICVPCQRKTGGVMSISIETLKAVNASELYSVKLDPELGGGYMASIEVLHQLHCLNILRQATYEDYYRDKAEPWQDSPQTLRYHLGKHKQITTTQGKANT
jgi:hypothetical protein